MDDNSTFRAGPLILKLKGILFDVTEFAESHPGGPDILWQSKDESIDEYFKGSKALGGLRHCHSKSALELLHKMRITPGSQEQQKDPVDYSKPMLSQVGSLGDHYWAWLHQPISHDIRIFQSDVAEFFSRTYWWLVPTIWLPVAVCLLNKAITNYTDQFGWVLFALLFLMGIFTWTLMEYLLHRFLFHARPPADSPFWIRAHFLLHGLHHKTPFDKGRLVFPPVPATIIFLSVFGFFSLLLPFPISRIVTAGCLVGYVGYDVIHYYLHHGHPLKCSYWGRMKSYHYAHHFKDWSKGFGISSKLWDFPLGTQSRC